MKENFVEHLLASLFKDKRDFMDGFFSKTGIVVLVQAVIITMRKVAVSVQLHLPIRADNNFLDKDKGNNPFFPNKSFSSSCVSFDETLSLELMLYNADDAFFLILFIH